MFKYKNRIHAGLELAKLLTSYQNDPQTIVLALPRGGVPVAFEVARKLAVPLDVLIVRKLGVPGHEEYAMGAVTIGNIVYLDNTIVKQVGVHQVEINRVLEAEKKELARRQVRYRGQKPLPNLETKTVILIDDGIATGATMKAAIAFVKQKKPATIIVAVPVAASSSIAEMQELVDDVVCPLRPVDFSAVGLWYGNFAQTTDDEVIEKLRTVLTQRVEK